MPEQTAKPPVCSGEAVGRFKKGCGRYTIVLIPVSCTNSTQVEAGEAYCPHCNRSYHLRSKESVTKCQQLGLVGNKSWMGKKAN